MPEGDTIFRSARAMQRALGGKLCTGFETALAPLARVDDDAPIAGRTIERVEALGKWLLVHFSGDLILLTHMLMSGSWHLYKTGEKWWMPKDRMRVVLRTEDWQAVAFNVPVAEFHTARSLARNTQVPKLGIDVLGDEYSVESGVARLKAYAAAHPEAEIAVVLLNQRVLAGLGNVYKSEVAFAAGVNPFRAMSTLTERELEQMAEMAGKWMRVNVLDGARDGISTYFGNRRTTGNSNRDDRLWVYARAGQECRRCGATIETRKQGLQARSTFWCPACQPWIPASGQTTAAPVGRAGKRRLAKS
jgi:endonuclease-8